MLDSGYYCRHTTCINYDSDFYYIGVKTLRENETKEKVVCNKMDLSYERCRKCQHGEGENGDGHFPIGTCDVDENKCSRVLTDAYGIKTQCVVKKIKEV